MNRSRRRVVRIERIVQKRARCRVCAGAGRVSLAVQIVGEPPRSPAGCVGCGKVKSVKWVHVEASDS